MQKSIAAAMADFAAMALAEAHLRDGKAEVVGDGFYREVILTAAKEDEMKHDADGPRPALPPSVAAALGAVGDAVRQLHGTGVLQAIARAQSLFPKTPPFSDRLSAVLASLPRLEVIDQMRESGVMAGLERMVAELERVTAAATFNPDLTTRKPRQ